MAKKSTKTTKTKTVAPKKKKATALKKPKVTTPKKVAVPEAPPEPKQMDAVMKNFIPYCPLCEKPIRGDIIDYGTTEDKLFFIRKCCDKKLYYERDWDEYNTVTHTKKKKEPEVEAPAVSSPKKKKKAS